MNQSHINLFLMYHARYHVNCDSGKIINNSQQHPKKLQLPVFLGQKAMAIIPTWYKAHLVVLGLCIWHSSLWAWMLQRSVKSLSPTGLPSSTAEFWTRLRSALKPSPSFYHFILTHFRWFWGIINNTFIRDTLMRLVLTSEWRVANWDRGAGAENVHIYLFVCLSDLYPTHPRRALGGLHYNDRTK